MPKFPETLVALIAPIYGARPPQQSWGQVLCAVMAVYLVQSRSLFYPTLSL